MGRKVSVEIVGDASSLQRAFGQASGAGSRFGSTLGKVFKVGGLAAAAGIGYAIKSAADFETTLNKFQAVSGATGKQMASVGSLAKALGNDIKLPGVSASDAAEAMTELAKGGLSVHDSMKAVRGTLQLATAAQVDNAEAATITADALNAFGLSGDKAGKVADLLAASANASTAEISDMALGMKAASAVFVQGHQSVTDLTTALGLMANAGIKGSDAGTSLKTMMLSLMAPTDKGAAAMKTLGINVRDASGQMLPMRDLIQVFTERLGKMGDAQRDAALKTIFGTDAIRAANIILTSGTGKWDKMTTAVSRHGAAAALAAAQSKGFNGAMENFKSTLETLAITFGQTLLPVATKTMRTLSKELGNAGPTLMRIGKAAAEGIPKAVDFLKRLADAAKTVKHAIDPLIDSIGGWGKVIGAIALGAFITKLTTLAGLGGGLRGTATGLKGVGGGLLGLKGALIAIAAVDFKKSIFDVAKAGDWVGAFKNAMMKYNPIVIPFTISMKVAKTILPHLPNPFTGVKWPDVMVPAPNFNWTQWKQGLTKGVFSATDALKPAITQGFKSAEGTANAAGGFLAQSSVAGIRSKLGGASAAGRGLGSAAAGGVKSTAAGMGTAATAAASRAVGAVTGSSGRMRAGGAAMGRAATAGLTASMAAMAAAARRSASAAASAVAGTSGAWSSAGSSLGSALTAGVISGLGGLIGSVTSMVTSAIGAAMSAAHGYAGIHSPSRLYAKEIGEPLGQGIVAGFERGMSGFEAAVIRAITGAARKARGMIKAAMLDAVPGASDLLPFPSAPTVEGDIKFASRTGLQAERDALPEEIYNDRNAITDLKDTIHDLTQQLSADQQQLADDLAGTVGEGDTDRFKTQAEKDKAIEADRNRVRDDQKALERANHDLVLAEKELAKDLTRLDDIVKELTRRDTLGIKGDVPEAPPGGPSPIRPGTLGTSMAAHAGNSLSRVGGLDGMGGPVPVTIAKWDGLPIVVNVNVEGSIQTEDQFAKTLAPKIRAEISRIGGRNINVLGV